jgi:hypothetical protein
MEAPTSTKHKPATDMSAEAIEFAGTMYDAARKGEKDIIEKALTAGVPANLTNEKGDTLVSRPEP